MKKVFFFLLILAYLVPAQESFKDNFNAILFGGYEFVRENRLINNHFYGVYLDGTLYRTHPWMFGVFGIASRHESQNNISGHKGKGYELGGGLFAAMYSTSWLWWPNHHFFQMLSVGAKYSVDQGGFRNNDGEYFNGQEDIVVTLGYNGIVIRRKQVGFLPRTQLMINYQFPVKTEGKSFWNNEELEHEAPWSKTNLWITGKQSVIGLRLGGVILSPKVLGQYHKTLTADYLGVGAEVSLYQVSKDDFVYLNAIYKFGGKDARDTWQFNLNISIMQMF